MIEIDLKPEYMKYQALIYKFFSGLSKIMGVMILFQVILWCIDHFETTRYITHLIVTGIINFSSQSSFQNAKNLAVE